MGKKPVSQPFFDPPGMPDQATPPHKAEQPDKKSRTENIQGISKQTPAGHGPDCKIIYNPFDNQGNKKLKDINREKRKKTDKNNGFAFCKIRFENMV